MAGLEPGDREALGRCLEVIQANLASVSAAPAP
jgi:hypothetical protein